MKIRLTVAARTLFLGAWLLGGTLRADVVILQYGNIVTGQVLQQDDDGVQIQTKTGTVRYPTSMVKEVRREDAELSTGRIPSWVTIISQLTTNEWAHEIKQIPATVIDNGSLRNVPYISFRCNTGGYEINIYGDLNKPACVEMGVIGYLVKNNQAKTNCQNFICSVLTSDSDKEFVQALKWNARAFTTNDLTFEITSPEEPDAYGGWWISVYNEDEIEKARASGAELLAITQPKIKPAPVVAAPLPTPTAPVENDAWTASDISTYSRPTANATSSGGGSVYVHSYHRTDGTYVSGYYRHSRK